MAIELPELPYAKDALAPHISAETIDFHYGAHHATYVKNLNNLIRDTEFAEASLEDMISKAEGGIFNNAAQVWNHTFYWNSVSPDGGGEPTGIAKDVIEQTRNADNPITEGKKPLLTCDVWEHAYYIDYRHARPQYVEAFWNLVNWDAVAGR